jgi:hypothetical protein
MEPPSTSTHRGAALRLSLLAAAALAACGGMATGKPQVTITVSAPANLGTIEPGAATQVAATVVNDAANRGVT